MTGAGNTLVGLPDLVKVMEAGLAVWNGTDEEDAEHWDPTAIHASDIGAILPGEGCMRQIWLRTRGAEKYKPSLGEVLMLDHGNRLHERATKLLRLGFKAMKSDWHIHRTEVELTGKLPYDIHGTIDVDLRNKATRQRAIIDYKTKRGCGIQHIIRNNEPSARNKIQVNVYQTIEVDIGGVLYIDREGQNGLVQFPVERNDAIVHDLAPRVIEIVRGDDCPPLLDPKVTVKENTSTAHSVYCDMPWQCDYCAYLDVSCPGAMPEHFRDRKIVAKIKKGTQLYQIENREKVNVINPDDITPAEDCEDMLLLVRRHIGNAKIKT